jgi:dihydropteroate synthase
VLISVDTWRHEVAEAACRAGAGLLNDTWAGIDPKLAEVAAPTMSASSAPTPGAGSAHRRPPQPLWTAGGDVVDSTLAGVIDLAEAARAAGVPEDRIIIDPTPDFGKNTYQSLRLLRELDRFVATGYPVLLAISRKDFVGEAIGDVRPAGPTARDDRRDRTGHRAGCGDDPHPRCPGHCRRHRRDRGDHR